MKKIRDFFILLFFFSLLTYFVMFLKRQQDILGSESYEKLSKVAHKDRYVVIWEEEELRLRLPMENFLVGLLAGTIPPDYEEEVLKAQAIVLRSELCYRYEEAKEKGEEGDCLIFGPGEWNFWTDLKMQDVWGDQYETNLKKCTDAVLQTQGMYMAYDSRPVEGFFHAMSAGKTRSRKMLSSGENLGYLKETICADNLSDLQYEEEIFLSLGQVGELSEGTFDETGYLISVKKDGELISGEQLRDRLGLASSNISWNKEDENYRFIVRGKGHGFGLDQYYGNRLAQKGKDYREILETFFADITFQRVE